MGWERREEVWRNSWEEEERRKIGADCRRWRAERWEREGVWER